MLKLLFLLYSCLLIILLFAFLLQLNVHQRSLEAAGIELCGAGGSVPQGQPSSAGSVGSAPSPASPRPTPQPRPPLATTSSQPSRTLDDDRSTDGRTIIRLNLNQRVVSFRCILVRTFMFSQLTLQAWLPEPQPRIPMTARAERSTLTRTALYSRITVATRHQK